MQKIKYIPQHKDGYYLTVRTERTNDFMSAVRFNSIEDMNAFLHGYYGPGDPENYHPATIKITYELESV